MTDTEKLILVSQLTLIMTACQRLEASVEAQAVALERLEAEVGVSTPKPARTRRRKGNVIRFPIERRRS